MTIVNGLEITGLHKEYHPIIPDVSDIRQLFVHV